MSADHELSRDVDVDLGGIFASIWRHKFKLILAAILVTVLAFFVIQALKPRFEAEARILIRSADPVLSRGEEVLPQQQQLDQTGVASQVELLKSRAIATDVIADLGLARLPEFDDALSSGPLDEVMALLGIGERRDARSAEDRVLEAFYDKLTVHQADATRVIVVKFWSNDPALAAAVPNRIADEYLKMQEALKRGANPDELAKLQPEIDALRKRVLDAEAAVADYRASSDILDGRDNQSLATQELSELSTELGRVRAQLSRAEANAAAVERALRSGALDSVSSVLQSPLIQRLRERQVTLNAQLSDLSTTLLPRHPSVQRVQSQIATLDRQIRAETGKILDSLREDVRIARSREDDLIQRRNQLKAEAGRVGKDQVELRALEREANAQRELLNAYLVRFKEATARQTRQFLPADAYVFARAQEPAKPYFPRKGPMLAGAFFGTLMLGAMVTLAGAILSGAAARQAASPVRYHEPVRASEPTGADREAQAHVREALDAPPLAPSMEALTQPIHPAMPNGAVTVSAAARSAMMLGRARIAMLDPTGQDRGMTAMAFARLLSSHGASVVLVDLGYEGTATSMMLGDTHAVGLRDVLAGKVSIADALHGDSGSGAHLVPTGVSTIEDAARQATPLKDVLTQLQSSYSYVVLDCGPTDVSGLARVSDRNTVVVFAAPDPADPTIALSTTMHTRTGHKPPLVVSPSLDERIATGLVAA